MIFVNNNGWQHGKTALFTNMKKNEEIAKMAGYFVDKDGNLLRNGRKLKTFSDSSRGGYNTFHATYNGHRFILKIHRLQAFQKFGAEIYKEGTQVRHLNGNPADNSFDNISIGSISQNQMDIPVEIRKSRTKPRKQRPIGWSCKLGDCLYDVEKIVELKKQGYSLRQISREMDIKSVGHISKILNRTAKIRGLL